MSLINDALRRTKQVQQQAPSAVAPGPQIPPLETAPVRARGPGLMPVGALAAAGLLALFLIWQGIRGLGPAPTALTSPAGRGSSPGQAASPASASHETASPAPLSAGQPAVGGGDSAGPPGRVRETTNAPVTSIAVISGPDSASDALAATPPETSPPGPPAIRLQAIVFHPTRPSAMINGKTLFVGDMLGEMQLVAIGRESATLVGGGQTNLLTLR